MRDSIKASDGMILTNGEVYGTEIFLAEGVDSSTFYEIPLAEYEAKMKESEDSDLNEY